MGCFVTKRVVVDGCKIGYMYREEPDSEFPDSGWRFFAGDETDEYANTPDNLCILCVNTVCNYDESIIPFLNMPCGTAWEKHNGTFIQC